MQIGTLTILPFHLISLVIPYASYLLNYFWLQSCSLSRVLTSLLEVIYHGAWGLLSLLIFMGPECVKLILHCIELRLDIRIGVMKHFIGYVIIAFHVFDACVIGLNYDWLTDYVFNCPSRAQSRIDYLPCVFRYGPLYIWHIHVKTGFPFRSDCQSKADLGSAYRLAPQSPGP